MTPARLPGSRWTLWPRSSVMRVGLLTGAGLICVMVAALLLANRAPWLEGFAATRIYASYAVFGAVILAPVWRFRQSPAQLFACGMVGWVSLSLAYAVLGDFYFENLFIRLDKTPFLLFLLGGMIYGAIAVAAWVGSLLAAARHHPIVHSRHHSIAHTRHRHL